MKIIYIVILLSISGCAHIDYAPSVNPHTALSEIVTKYALNTSALTCEGVSAVNCLALVHELNQLMLEHPNNKVILSKQNKLPNTLLMNLVLRLHRIYKWRLFIMRKGIMLSQLTI